MSHRVQRTPWWLELAGFRRSLADAHLIARDMLASQLGDAGVVLVPVRQF